MPISGRIYHRWSIKLPNTSKIDIMMLNDNKEYEKIGSAELIENEVGLWANNIEYFVSELELNKLLKEYHNEFKKKYPDHKYSSMLTITCSGFPSNEYKKEDSVELKFLTRHLLTSKNLKDIIRDLKISSLIQD